MASSTVSPSSGDLTTHILQSLDNSSPLLSTEALPTAGFAEVKAALDRLASRDMVSYETIEREEAILEPEGELIAANGSHEARVFEALRSAVDGLTVQDLEKAIGDKNIVKIGQGKAFKEKWISKTKGAHPLLFFSFTVGESLTSIFFLQTVNSRPRQSRYRISPKSRCKL